MDTRSRVASLSILAISFAVFVGMAVALTGRLHAPGLTFALALGSLAGAVFAVGRPIRALRALPSSAILPACAGGFLAFFAAPAIVAAVRLSDAPAGSVVVFWMTGGWAAVAALSVAAAPLVRGPRLRALAPIAGAAAALAGAAAVVADWERPSSFSPLVRFPVQELAILAAGVLFLVGGLLLVRAAVGGRHSGAVLYAAATAVVSATVWLAVSGPALGLGSIAELPVEVAIAAVSWGVVCAVWPVALESAGTAGAAGMLALAPVLLSGLILVEQVVGVAGPQPLIVGGVVAGSLVLASGVLALLGANREPASTTPALWVRMLAVAAAACAAVALALPALVADAKVSGSVGSFSGAWTMTGIESIAALCALALALALVAGVFSPRPLWLTLAGLAACLSWPWLLAVPTHVLTTWLAPGIQSYYGTEYGTIAFTPVQNLPMYVAVAASGVGFLVLSVAAGGLARWRSGALSPDHGGSHTP